MRHSIEPHQRPHRTPRLRCKGRDASSTPPARKSADQTTTGGQALVQAGAHTAPNSLEGARTHPARWLKSTAGSIM